MRSLHVNANIRKTCDRKLHSSTTDFIKRIFNDCEMQLNKLVQGLGGGGGFRGHTLSVILAEPGSFDL